MDTPLWGNASTTATTTTKPVDATVMTLDDGKDSRTRKIHGTPEIPRSKTRESFASRNKILQDLGCAGGETSLVYRFAETRMRTLTSRRVARNSDIPKILIGLEYLPGPGSTSYSRVSERYTGSEGKVGSASVTRYFS
uniref:Uncharacterized protein n=1 Tax=Vespula pensylvanica TaxID=30213 RepID=A0A834P8W2_VESPE|nr:hypothetical protein H0235_005404 [Vespula pensylvanica]